ncbi:MAG: MBL fold metallo-hydrolase [Clostridiales bacterium]|nr:MBL fold metallo-hydrolase [Clostridiales bacterium]
MGKRKARLAALLILCMLFPQGCAAEETDSVRLTCLNIGKADCMLLQWRDRAYLIDTGYWQTYSALETMLSQYGVDHLDGVFLTHCHKDHAGGLPALARSNVRIDAWYASPIYYSVEESEHPALLAARERGQEVTWLHAGDKIECSGASFTVLGPLNLDTENENNNSLVMRFTSPAGSILLAGDMKTEEEEDLLSVGALSPCDVLKAGHHGDNNATGAGLLSAVQPKAALILTNTQEEPDTPDTSTVKRLMKAGCSIYISQEYDDALLLTLRNGTPSVQNVQWSGIPAPEQGLRLSIDLENDTVTVYNDSSSSVTLKDCLLFSTKGEEALPLPETTLSPGATFVIGSKSTSMQTDLVWQDKKIWHKSKRDMAILYDAWGRALARTDNGLEE